MSEMAKRQVMGKNVNGYKATIWIACFLLLVSSIYLMIVKEINDVVVIVVFVSILTLIVNFFVFIGMAKPLQDERTRKISTAAATYAWYFTLAVMGFFLFTGYYAGRLFTAAEMFGLFTLLLVGGWIASYVYLNVKGDVE